MRRTTLLALAILVAAFVTLYPALDSAGMCDSGECPQIVNSASGGFSGTCVPALASLAAAPVVGAAAAGLRLREATTVQSPSQIYYAPESPPPRLSL